MSETVTTRSMTIAAWQWASIQTQLSVVLAGDSMFVRDPTSSDNGLREVTARPTSAMLVVPGECGFCATVGHDDYWLSMHAKCRAEGIVAPKLWTDLTGPCKTCAGRGGYEKRKLPCQVCKGSGRERVELWACSTCEVDGECSHNVDVLVATASVEVLPVVAESGTFDAEVYSTTNGYVVIQRVLGDPSRGENVTSEHLGKLDPLPVPGRDWVVVLTDRE